MAWDGDQLWLLSMGVENHFEAHEGAPSRLATLDNGRWRVVDTTTPPLTYGQQLWWYDERLVIGEGPYGGEGHAYDPQTGTWSALSSPGGDDACAAPAAGPGPRWLSVGATLTTGRTGDAVSLPPCPALTGDGGQPDLAVWAGDDLFVWGADFHQETTAGLRWTPPGAGPS